MLYSLPMKIAKDCANQDKGCGKSQRMTEFDMLKISQSLINISL